MWTKTYRKLSLQKVEAYELGKITTARSLFYEITGSELESMPQVK